MSRILGQWYQLRAPLLLLALQSPPMEIRPTEDGASYRLVFAAGGGQYESRLLTCAGDVASAKALPVRAVGVSADIYPSSDMRITAAIGGHDDGAEFTGATGGIEVALERPRFGIGAGLVKLGGDSTSRTFYLRIGGREGTHFRTELASPSATGPLLGIARIGVGWNRTANAHSFGFVGLSRGLHSDPAYPLGVFGEFGIPVSDRVALVAGGAFRPSHAHIDAVGQLGLSVTGGRRR